MSNLMSKSAAIPTLATSTLPTSTAHPFSTTATSSAKIPLSAVSTRLSITAQNLYACKNAARQLIPQETFTIRSQNVQKKVRNVYLQNIDDRSRDIWSNYDSIMFCFNDLSKVFLKSTSECQRSHIAKSLIWWSSNQKNKNRQSINVTNQLRWINKMDDFG